MLREGNMVVHGLAATALDGFESEGWIRDTPKAMGLLDLKKKAHGENAKLGISDFKLRCFFSFR